MIDIIINVLSHDSILEVGKGIGYLVVGFFTAFSAWTKKIKPFFEKKLVAPTAELADQINHGQFKMLRQDVNTMQEDMANLKQAMAETQADHARTDGKLDTIIAYTQNK